MVGPMLLLKMLHCKRMNRKKSGTSRTRNEVRLQGTSNEVSERNFPLTIKQEESEYDEQNVCRVCLKDGSIPIYGTSGFEDVSEALNTFGGIDVSSDDAYPKYLCKSCFALLQGAILFRKTAQQSDEALRQPSQDILMSDHEDNILDSFEDTSYDYEDQRSEFHEEPAKRASNFRCKRCDLEFLTLQEFSEHRLSQEHENVRKTCPICQNTYIPEYLKKHLALHKLETPYMCDICGKKFVIQGQFTRHRLTHFYNLPFKCSLCPYKGRFSESLKMHMRSHTGDKPYRCPQCPSRMFVNKSNLNKHMLTHKGEYDFKCDQCARGFYTKRDLELHFKVDHSGIKDHVCNLCGKAFGYRKQMMKHQLKVHKREKLRSGRTPLYLLVETKKQEEGEQS